jgi:hypothetical protein
MPGRNKAKWEFRFVPILDTWCKTVKYFRVGKNIKRMVSLNRQMLRYDIIIIIIIIIHRLGRLIRSGIDALPSFPGASTISSPQMFVVEGVFRNSGVVHSFEMVYPVLFVFVFHVLYSRDGK